jgi:threonine synthase
MAMSTAAFAAAADLPCLVLMPADISDDRLSSIARFEPEIVRVDGDYRRSEAKAHGFRRGMKPK